MDKAARHCLIDRGVNLAVAVNSSCIGLAPPWAGGGCDIPSIVLLFLRLAAWIGEWRMPPCASTRTRTSISTRVGHECQQC